MAFHIAHISDTHLSAAKPFFVANFAAVARAIAAAAPDLLVNTGDISLNGAARGEDLAAARDLHARLALPQRFVPGNHDVGDNREVAREGDHLHLPISTARRELYCRYFGGDWWQLDCPGWRLIGVNAQLIGSELPAEAEQERFLAAAVAGAEGRALALFIHKPLFDADPAEQAVTGRFLNPAPRQRLFAAFGRRRPSLVASGHTHQFRATESAAMRQVWGPSTAFVIPDAQQPRYGTKQVGYAEHRLHADGRHESRLVRVAGTADLSIADFPDAG